MAQRILFVTSNGTGLGHLTRSMAIARRLGGELEPVVLTLSQAAPVVEEQGLHVEYMPSYSTPAAEGVRRWDRRLRRRLEAAIAELEPRVLAFDGASPYDGLVAVLRTLDPARTTSVWCRRAMWREGIGAEAIYWSSEFDLILEPGEYAADADRGLTAARRGEAEQVGPIVYLDPADLLSREAAAAELGLDPGLPTALVALGQGAELEGTVARSLETLAGARGWQVAALESSIAPELRVPEGVELIRGTYPISRLYRAFDVVVSAAGYNAFHELLAFGVPSVFVPMPRELDDQVARSRWAFEVGAARAVSGPGDPALEREIRAALNPSERDRMRAEMARLRPADGASEAARLLVPGRSSHPEETSTPTTPGRARARLQAVAVSAKLVRRVGFKLPAIVMRRAMSRVRHPPPAPAKVVGIALGLEGDALLEALGGLAKRTGTEPERLLAITDSLDFTSLRRAGYAFEYVPNAERAAAIGIEDDGYDAFAQRRIGLALAGRRKPKLVEDLNPGR